MRMSVISQAIQAKLYESYTRHSKRVKIHNLSTAAYFQQVEQSVLLKILHIEKQQNLKSVFFKSKQLVVTIISCL